MAIAFDAAKEATQSSVTSLTWEHTCTGSNLVLFVGTIVGSASQTATGVTYNGVSLTKVTGSQFSYAPCGTCVLWYLCGPATGAHNVVVSLSGTDNISAGASSYTGAAQSGQADVATYDARSGGNTSLPTTLTTLTDNSWTIGVHTVNQWDTISAGASTTRRCHVPGASGVLTMAIIDNNAAITPAGSNTITSTDGSGYWLGGMSTITPYVGGGGSTTNRRIRGTGISR